MRSLHFSALFVALAVLLGSGLARANGRFPSAGQVVIDPKDPNHIVLRATFGILETMDAGKHWGWICEQIVGYSGVEDPAMTVTSDGTIVAGIFEGLAVSHDRGCSWAFAGGPTKDQYMIDTALELDAPSHAVAITSSGIMGGFHVALIESLDDGKTWTQAGVAVDENFLAETIEVAPSNPMRVYLSGLLSPTLAGVIERSDDRGATWMALDEGLFAAGSGNDFIAAVDPLDPDRVYLRVQGDPVTHNPPDKLAVSADGGASWKVIYTAKANLLGFALSPDGKTIAVGGDKDPLSIASSSDYVFKPVSTVKPLCLKWAPSGLYACGNEFIEGFTLGRSNDEGKTFTHIYQLPDLEVLSCPAGDAFNMTCPPVWPMVAMTICAGGACGGGGGGSSVATVSAGSGGASSASGATPTTPANGSGCGCSTLPGRSALPAGGLLVLAALLGLRRKQRSC